MSTPKKMCPKCGEHCYAKMMNARGEVMYREDEFCGTCGAHLAASGICLNACHLSPASRELFSRLMADASSRVDERRRRAEGTA